jgi:hypothetical protein
LVDRTAHRFNDARKLEEQPFTRGLDDGAPQLKDGLAVMQALLVFRVLFCTAGISDRTQVTEALYMARPVASAHSPHHSGRHNVR